MDTLPEAVEKLEWYALRLKIETFHMIMKSGESPVNYPHPIAIEQVFGVLKYSDLQGFAVFGRFPCDLGARLREGGSA